MAGRGEAGPRLGVLGGTFNPLHLAHLVCAQEAYLQLALDRVLLVPTRIPPHKRVEVEPGAEHRLEMCRRAVADDPRIEVCDLEVRREGTSFTVDTLQELTAQTPNAEFFLILGGDVAAGLPSWREPERVLSLATVAVAERKGTRHAEIEAALCALPGGERTRYFDMPTIALSSTDVRERVIRGKPIKYIVPDVIDRYIHQEGLYTRDDTSEP